MTSKEKLKGRMAEMEREAKSLREEAAARTRESIKLHQVSQGLQKLRLHVFEGAALCAKHCNDAVLYCITYSLMWRVQAVNAASEREAEVSQMLQEAREASSSGYTSNAVLQVRLVVLQNRNKLS